MSETTHYPNIIKLSLGSRDVGEAELTAEAGAILSALASASRRADEAELIAWGMALWNTRAFDPDRSTDGAIYFDHKKECWLMLYSDGLRFLGGGKFPVPDTKSLELLLAAREKATAK